MRITEREREILTILAQRAGNVAREELAEAVPRTSAPWT
jgi:hypothetical protein